MVHMAASICSGSDGCPVDEEPCVCLRLACPDDAGAISAIYRPYVTDTAITFEVVPPDAREFSRRIARTLDKYPYIVATDGDAGRILGYAYTGAFKGRAAYDWSVETSIYVDGAARGRRVGSALHQALVEASRIQGVTNLEACIAYPDQGGSVGFHEHQGYRMVGRFEACAYKLGRWWDMVWMELHIANHACIPAPLRPLPEVRAAVREMLGRLSV